MLSFGQILYSNFQNLQSWRQMSLTRIGHWLVPFTRKSAVSWSNRTAMLKYNKYECRLRKRKTGSRPPPLKDGVKKRYGTTVRQPGLCQVRIKVTRTVAEPVVVTIERMNEEQHQHDLDRSREVAPSSLAIQLAAGEAAKGYAAGGGRTADA